MWEFTKWEVDKVGIECEIIAYTARKLVGLERWMNTHPSSSLWKHLGYFKHIFRLSQLHQCDQGMLFLKVHWGPLLLVKLASVFLQKSYLAIFLAFYYNHATKELSRGKCVSNKPHQKCWFIDFLKGDTKRGKLLNYTFSNCKHSLNFTCHTHKMNAPKVTKTWLK